MAEITAALAVMDRFHPVRPPLFNSLAERQSHDDPGEYRNHLAREEEAWAVIQRCRQLGEAWAENEARLGR